MSVRTVQYYDSRGILIPSLLSEGGRRLYSEEDLKKMKIICFLRDVGLPINSICELLAEDDPASVVSILLDQQESILKEELNERQQKLEMILKIKKKLKNVSNFSVESLGDIAHIMKVKSKQRIIKKRLLNFSNLFWLYISLTLCICTPTGILVFPLIINNSSGFTSWNPRFLSSGSMVISAL